VTIFILMCGIAGSCKPGDASSGVDVATWMRDCELPLVDRDECRPVATPVRLTAAFRGTFNREPTPIRTLVAR
jgi:hypothetical protein